MTVRQEGELALLPPLLMWLRRRGRIRADTLYVRELPWFGRRVDLATLTTTRRTTAYELKLADNRRAIEQAAYNALSFDRSYVVTSTMPSNGLISLARKHDVGVIVITSASDNPITVLRPWNRAVGGPVRKKLLTTMRHLGTEVQHV